MRDPDRRPRTLLHEGLKAALPAALLSGLPSTIHALLRRRDPLEASAAAGSILLPREQRRPALLLAAIPVHVSLSAAWAVLLAATLPRENPLAEGTLAGIAIAAIDLGLVGRRVPRIAALEPGPQIADHIAFGIIVALTLTYPRSASSTSRR